MSNFMSNFLKYLKYKSNFLKIIATILFLWIFWIIMSSFYYNNLRLFYEIKLSLKEINFLGSFKIIYELFSEIFDVFIPNWLKQFINWIIYLIKKIWK